MLELAGYRGRARELLSRAKASIGDVLEVKTDWGIVSGTLVPRYEHADGNHIVLKLKSGYNVGLSTSKLHGVTVMRKGEKPAFSPPKVPKSRTGLSRVLIVGTGGTIASRVDYRTGAVSPAMTAGELHALIPELSDIAEVVPEILFSILSENIGPAHWSKLSARIVTAVKEGYSGVVVTHGTDTLGYTAAALSFALRGIPIPVLLVGAQRSPDRPSSDATQNLIGAVSIAANAPFSGVYVAMHLSESDDGIALHRGTRVRKNHTSRRDAFLSVGVPLAAVWRRTGLEDVSPDLPPRGVKEAFKPAVSFDGHVALLKFYPSMPGSLISAASKNGARALIIEGTGLGHVSSQDIAAIRAYIRKGGFVCMTSQCINGRVDLKVYDTGRDLALAGVLPLEDMLAETALVKAMWALANTKGRVGAKSIMLENLAGEISTRRFPGRNQ